MEIGFIGTGNMGRGMVESLLRRGHQVSVFNRTPSKAQRLTELGAHAVRSIAEACEFPVVFTMLADDRALEEVTWAPTASSSPCRRARSTSPAVPSA